MSELPNPIPLASPLDPHSLERALDTAPDGFVVVDRAGTLVHINRTAARMLGLDRDEAIGQPAWSLLPPTIVPLLRTGYDRILRERVVATAIEYVEPFGRWLEVRGFPFEDGVAAFFVDVTGRETEKQRRHFLRGLDAALRPLGDPDRIMEMAASAVGEHFRVLRAGYAEVDDEAGLLRVRAQYREGVGELPAGFQLANFGPELTAAGRAGRTLAIRDIANDPLAARGAVALAAIGARAMITVPLVKDGRFVAVFAILAAEPRDWSSADIALMEEVAERTWAAVEAARAQKERSRLVAAIALERARLRELFMHAPLPIAVVDVRGRVELANPQFQALFNGRPVVGDPIRVALPELAGSGLFEMIDAALAVDPDAPAAEIRGRITVGHEPEQRTYEFLCQPRVEPDSRPSGAVLAGVDITEQVNARAEVEALYNDVREANQAKSEFLATISHELRTPLTAIVGYTDILESGVGGPLSEKQKQHLGRIKVSTWHLLQLIEQILTFARVEAGREELRLEVAELGSLISETVGLVQPTAGTKRLHIALEIPERPLTVETDPGKVRQILLNLLSNAIKFTEEGEIRVALRVTGGHAELVVADTGVGIPEEQQQHIFEAFTQVGRRRIGGLGGAGLGLTITRRLAQLMGGDIQLHSVPGQGSTFTVALPLRRD